MEGTSFNHISYSDFFIFPLLCILYQWLKLTADDVKEQIYKLAKKGLTPSQIGQYKTSQTACFCAGNKREGLRTELDLVICCSNRCDLA